MSDCTQYCTFEVEDALYGIEVEHVQEIIRHQSMTAVPHAPRAVVGLINLRGEIVPAIEVRFCLGLSERPPEREPTNVVIRTGEGAVSLLVDSIGDVLEVPHEAYEPPPDNLRGPIRRLLRGVYELGDGLLMALSADEVVRCATEADSDS